MLGHPAASKEENQAWSQSQEGRKIKAHCFFKPLIRNLLPCSHLTHSNHTPTGPVRTRRVIFQPLSSQHPLVLHPTRAENCILPEKGIWSRILWNITLMLHSNWFGHAVCFRKRVRNRKPGKIMNGSLSRWGDVPGVVQRRSLSDLPVVTSSSTTWKKKQKANKKKKERANNRTGRPGEIKEVLPSPGKERNIKQIRRQVSNQGRK